MELRSVAPRLEGPHVHRTLPFAYAHVNEHLHLWETETKAKHKCLYQKTTAVMAKWFGMRTLKHASDRDFASAAPLTIEVFASKFQFLVCSTWAEHFHVRLGRERISHTSSDTVKSTSWIYYKPRKPIVNPLKGIIRSRLKWSTLHADSETDRAQSKVLQTPTPLLGHPQSTTIFLHDKWCLTGILVTLQIGILTTHNQLARTFRIMQFGEASQHRINHQSSF